MNSELFSKLKESAISIFPISIVILIINFTLVHMPFGTLASFISGALLLIVGMGIFTLGNDMALMPIGELLGEKLTSSRNVILLIAGAFILGVVITIAEPDLQVLATQVPSIPNLTLITTVSIGVGIFLVIAIMRIVLQVKMSSLILILYGIAFSIAIFAGSEYIPVAFDSGGVTTGPVTVPFILALGAGVSIARGGGGENVENDSFGLCGICSIGPIIALQILGRFYRTGDVEYVSVAATEVTNFSQFLLSYLHGFKLFAKEVLLALIPIFIVFLIFQLFMLKLSKKRLSKIFIGMIYTFVGLTIFLTGVNIGFMPAGTYIGHAIASLSYNWILIPISVIMGFFVITAEPAVYSLNKQIEDITSGAISKKMMMIGLSCGVGIALSLAMIRIMTGVNILFILIPGYIIAITLSFIVPQLFTAIALDSGGVASGAMAAAFLLPFALGACEALGGNIMTDAFGIIAMIAMMPIISVQVVGLIYTKKLKKLAHDTEHAVTDVKDDIDYDEDEDIIEF